MPKLVLVGPPLDYATPASTVSEEEIDLTVCALSLGRVHRAIQVTGGIALAAAAAIPGTLVAGCARETRASADGDVIRVGHPSGITDLAARVARRDNVWHVESGSVARTARRIMEGNVLVPSTSTAAASNSSIEQPLEVIERLRDRFAARGIGGRVGFGERPAIVVVDATRGFTDPSMPLGADASEMIESVNAILESARDARAPVVFTICVYDPVAQIWNMKIPSNGEMLPGTSAAELDPRLKRHRGDAVIVKHHASAFFGTSFHTYLTERSIDTLIVTGMTTSGCVRATVVDGCSFGFHVIVPEEAVADRAYLPHTASLFDMDAKYGDVVHSGDVTAYLRSLSEMSRNKAKPANPLINDIAP